MVFRSNNQEKDKKGKLGKEQSKVNNIITKEDSKEEALEKIIKLFSFLDTPISSNDVLDFKQVPTKTGVKAIATIKTEYKRKILGSRSKRGKLTLRNTSFLNRISASLLMKS